MAELSSMWLSKCLNYLWGTGESQLLALPDELLECIICHLPPKDRLTVTLVCRRLKTVARSHRAGCNLTLRMRRVMPKGGWDDHAVAAVFLDGLAMWAGCITTVVVDFADGDIPHDVNKVQVAKWAQSVVSALRNVRTVVSAKATNRPTADHVVMVFMMMLDSVRTQPMRTVKMAKAALAIKGSGVRMIMQRCADMQRLSLRQCEIPTGLPFTLEHLTSLSVGLINRPAGLNKVLAALPNLKRLRMDLAQIPDRHDRRVVLGYSVSLPRLEYLRITGANMLDPTFLSTCTSLTYLYISTNSLASPIPTLPCTQLKTFELWLGGAEIIMDSLEFLYQCANLKKLSLGGGISFASRQLSNIPSIKTLCIAFTNILVFSLDDIPNVKRLSLVYCPSLVRVVAHDPHPMRLLEIGDCPCIREISALPFCRRLRQVWLTKNPLLATIDNLSCCKRLDTLLLIDLPALKSVSALAHHPSLRLLVIKDVPQPDLMPLATCPNLEFMSPKSEAEKSPVWKALYCTLELRYAWRDVTSMVRDVWLLPFAMRAVLGVDDFSPCRLAR